ncbi:hEGF domain containing protein [Trichuris trichiura]|uniref:HEGF domain containing protein n=1 Tax=Trichuris trichiura TaxID=36087 RepID=A0A077ZJP9_TRITR|nr:hEGF domain containing protein [Trichuris trichiura]
MFVQIWLLEASPTSCPHDGHNRQMMRFGWKDDKKLCYTFLKVNPSRDFDPGIMPNKQFRKLCQNNFKKGFISPIKKSDDVKIGKQHPLLKVYSGVTIKFSSHKGGVYYKWPNHYIYIWEYSYEYESPAETVAKTSTRSHGSEEKDVYGSNLDEDWFMFRSHVYDSQLNEGKFPKCTIVKVSDKKAFSDKVIPCAELEKENDLHILCAHSTYNDCVEEKVNRCSYVNRSKNINGWYDYHYRIKVENEPPYGRECEHYYDHGKNCTPVCTGRWSEWMPPTLPLCANNGKFTRRRFQAQSNEKDVHLCNENDKSCCQMSTEHIIDDCYDYDEAKTVKLDSSKCKNGGTLTKTPTGYNKCDCASGFKGTQCEENACANECKNSGTCIVRNVGVLCVCLPGFSGPNCETVLKLCGAEKAFCENGGSCIFLTENQGSYCKCTKNFGGDHCTEKTEYCQTDTCSNSGVCHNVTEKHSFYCRCNAGRTGKKCEVDETGFGFTIKKFTAGKGPPYLYVAIGIILTLLFLTCGTGTVIHHRRRKHRKGHRGNDMSSYSSAFSSRFASTLSRFSTTGGSKATSRMSTKTADKSLATKRGASKR